jgi:transcriptional regulator with XRE-family HTH domain
MIDFGHKLKTIREKLGLKQAAFAEILGVKQSFYSLVETNKTSLPLTKSFVLFTKLGVNPSWFFSPDENINDDVAFLDKPAYDNKVMESNHDYGVIAKLIDTINSQQDTINQLTQRLLSKDVGSAS